MAIDLDFNNEGDISISGGDLALKQGVDEVVQAVRITLLLIKGESAYNTDAGVDWFDTMFSTNSSLEEKEFEIREAILSVPGVKSLQSFLFEADTVTRSVRITYTATSFEGVVTDQIEVAP